MLLAVLFPVILFSLSLCSFLQVVCPFSQMIQQKSISNLILFEELTDLVYCLLSCPLYSISDFQLILNNLLWAKVLNFFIKYRGFIPSNMKSLTNLADHKRIKWYFVEYFFGWRILWTHWVSRLTTSTKPVLFFQELLFGSFIWFSWHSHKYLIKIILMWEKSLEYWFFLLQIFCLLGCSEDSPKWITASDHKRYLYKKLFSEK